MEEQEKLFFENLGEHNYLLRDGADEFLVDFCKKNNPDKVLEIGTAYGYSAYLMLKNCDCKVTTIELDKTKHLIAKQNLEKVGFLKRCNLICGDAKNEINNLKEKYQLIFLDGPKGQYIKYLPRLIELLSPNGYLIADNIYFQNKIFTEGVIPHKHRTIVNNLRKFINEITTNKNLQTKIYNIGDGISLSKKI